jgi:hypothetical protein
VRSTGEDQPPLFGGLAWLDVGEPPAAVAAWRAARANRIGPIAGAIGGPLIGVLAGFSVLSVWPGVLGWSLTVRVELFLGVAVPIAIAEFFFNVWFIRWLANATNLRVRQLAVSAGQLHLVLTTGRAIDRAASEVSVSPEPIAGGWYQVSLPSGDGTTSFFVPGSVAAVLTAAAKR